LFFVALHHDELFPGVFERAQRVHDERVGQRSRDGCFIYRVLAGVFMPKHVDFLDRVSCATCLVQSEQQLALSPLNPLLRRNVEIVIFKGRRKGVSLRMHGESEGSTKLN
jgi:hypothetical protein